MTVGSSINVGTINLQQARQDEVTSRQKPEVIKGKNVESERAALKKQTQEFESMFIELVLKSMRDSVQKAGLVDGGNAEEIYKSMLDSEYAKTLAQQGTMGLAAAMERQLVERFGKEEPKASQTKNAAVESSLKVGLKTYANAVEKPRVAETNGLTPLQSVEKQAKINKLMP